MSILKRGLAGEPVKVLQQKLGVVADGRFGAETEEALKAHQRSNGLAVDGIAGPDTFAQMALYELILLKMGSSGQVVRRLQQALVIAADGQFGLGTEKAVKTFQKKNGLAADGIAGPETLARLALFKEITPAVVEASQLPPAAPAPGAAVAPARPRSIWETIKGLL
jgi:peptidoglycan hydrolase-like protein with peptidoglycan-binding domain